MSIARAAAADKRTLRMSDRLLRAIGSERVPY
jgi:hypothetical protein